VSQRELDLLPLATRARLTASAEGYERYARDVARYRALADDELLRVTKVCLKNLERVDDANVGGDPDLRVLLVPELWERIRPGTRTQLRQITSSIVEYRGAAEPSFWRRICRPETLAQLAQAAERTRAEVETLAQLSAGDLVERVRFAIAGADSARRFEPGDCVYEPGFAYRLVPVLAVRVADRAATDVRRSPSSGGTP
jgi:hypothetical protein